MGTPGAVPEYRQYEYPKPADGDIAYTPVIRRNAVAADPDADLFT